MIKILDLFSGIGGFSLGLEATGRFETVAFCEINPFCQKILKKHWSDVPIFEDITKLDGRMFKGKIDLICGGFPCQDISGANTQGKGLHGEKSGLWFEYKRLIEEINPTWVIIENVANLKSKGFATVLQNLHQLRYDVCWHNIPATAVGRPHKRERLFIVALKENGTVSLAYPDSIGCVEYEGFSEEVQQHRIEGIQREEIKQSDLPESPYGGDPNVAPEDIARATQSTIFRVAHGISRRLDCFELEQTPSDELLPKLINGLKDRKERVQSLGNSIVPAIAKIIGEEISYDRD